MQTGNIYIILRFHYRRMGPPSDGWSRQDPSRICLRIGTTQKQGDKAT